MPKTPTQRFLDKVKKTKGCWMWTGCVGKTSGYGLFGFDKLRSAHRVAWLIFKGPIPKGKCVLHKCDTKLCVNPDHLFIGTHKDNIRDMWQKGRQRVVVGSSLPHAKLNERSVRIIRELRQQGHKYYVIAARFGVNPVTVGDVIRGSSWVHVL